jgi:thiamine pyrophosphate-dependent acetolactate synthase large subunit-like protein
LDGEPDQETAWSRQDTPDLTGVTGSAAAILDEMAQLLAEQKLVPFFGAGISRAHSGIDAAELAHEIAQLVCKSPETLLSNVSDDYVDAFGESSFLEGEVAY